MIEIEQSVSELIKSQFPQIYREDGDNLVAFVTSYFEFLAQSNNAFQISRSTPDYADIDRTLDDFIIHFQKTYLNQIDANFSTDKRFVVKNILDYYRSKGSLSGLKLLLRLLYNRPVDVYIPGEDIFRASHSQWKQPEYIEIPHYESNRDFINQKITGSVSGATAYCEGIVTKNIYGKLIDVIPISGRRGTFSRGELISADGNYENSPKIFGSLSDISIDSNTSFVSVAIGDVLTIESDRGRFGKAVVSGVRDTQGTIIFTLDEGGSAFKEDSTVYISNRVLLTDNSDTPYSFLDEIYQHSYKITLANTGFISVGTEVTAYDASNNSLHTGSIIKVVPNQYFIVNTGNTKCSNTAVVSVDSTSTYSVGETLKQADHYRITISGNTGSFLTGETLVQEIVDPESNIVIETATCEIVTQNSTVITVNSAMVPIVNTEIFTGQTTGSVMTANVITQTETGATGVISEVTDSNTYVVDQIAGTFSNGEVYGVSSRLASDGIIQGIGVTDIYIGSNTDPSVFTGFEDITARGILVGQNTSALGIKTEDTFYTNGDIVDVDGQNLKTITQVSRGAGADVAIESIHKTDTITYYTDKVYGNNIIGQQYLGVGLGDAENGLGILSAITINDGGNGYTNGDVFSTANGGFNDQNPIAVANGTITTDANGTITEFIITNQGSGFYEVPDISLPVTVGSVANVTAVVSKYYGFPSSPLSDINSIIFDCLGTASKVVGEIESLETIAVGQNYDFNQFIEIVNFDLWKTNRREQKLTLDNNISLSIGEKIIQSSTGATGIITAKSFNNIDIKINRPYDYFETGTSIFGVVSGLEANVEQIQTISNTEFAAFNVDISGSSKVSTLLADVSVSVSGYGYEDGEEITLINSDGDIVATGTVVANTHGIGQGFWKTMTSHLSETSRIHDNNYYQEYSYDIITDLSLSKYKNIVLKLFHLAGTKMFATMKKVSDNNNSIQAFDSHTTITVS